VLKNNQLFEFALQLVGFSSDRLGSRLTRRGNDLFVAFVAGPGRASHVDVSVSLA